MRRARKILCNIAVAFGARFVADEVGAFDMRRDDDSPSQANARNHRRHGGDSQNPEEKSAPGDSLFRGRNLGVHSVGSFERVALF